MCEKVATPQNHKKQIMKEKNPFKNISSSIGKLCDRYGLTIGLLECEYGLSANTFHKLKRGGSITTRNLKLFLLALYDQNTEKEFVENIMMLVYGMLEQPRENSQIKSNISEFDRFESKKLRHKSDLAQYFFPSESQTSSLHILKRAIENNPEVLAALRAVGYKRNQRILTPRQVMVLYRFFGSNR